VPIDARRLGGVNRLGSPCRWPQVDFIEPSGLTSLQLSPAAQRHEHPTRGSAERADDFAVSVLRERLQRLRAHEAEAPEL
jgi:hypothetical protein